MKTMFALLLIGLGGWVIWLGHRRSESVGGVADKVGAEIANAWDGKARQPEHVWYYVGGGALALVGVALLVRKGST
jgi:hypothetical protein